MTPRLGSGQAFDRLANHQMLFVHQGFYGSFIRIGHPDIAAFLAGDLAAVAGIKMILARVALEDFFAFGHFEPFGCGLVRFLFHKRFMALVILRPGHGYCQPAALALERLFDFSRMFFGV